MKIMLSKQLLILSALFGAARSQGTIADCLSDGETIQLACDNIALSDTPDVSFEKITYGNYFVRARLACEGTTDVAAVACFKEEGDGGFGIGVVSQNEVATADPMCFNTFTFDGRVKKYTTICEGDEIQGGGVEGGGEGGADTNPTTGAGDNTRTSSSSRTRHGKKKKSRSSHCEVIVPDNKPNSREFVIRQVLEFVDIDEDDGATGSRALRRRNLAGK